MMGGGPPPAGKAEDEKKRQEAEAARKQRLLAGKAEVAKEKAEPGKAEEAPADPADTGPWKEETLGKRWVVITGVVDNEQMNKNWLVALKNPAIAYPQYLKVDAQRQIRQSDGDWSEWALVDEDAKFNVIDNLPEKDDEFVPEPKRPEALVDPLPFLRAGYWSGVHVASLVPADLLKAPEPAPGGMFGGRGMPGGGDGMGMMGGSGSRSMMGGRGGMGEMMGGGMGMMGGGDMSGGTDEAVTPNVEPKLMLRSIDFSVEPNITYRYRVRLVVKNPNYNRADVNPGTETAAANLSGPWSEPTVAVSVPADVSAYAQLPAQDNRRDDVVMFQVVRWNPASGQTVVKTDDAAPGFFIGEYGNVQEPSSEGGGAKSTAIDFNSRSFVLDSSGGRIRIPDIGVERNPFTVPAVAMVVEPDGGVVIRNQAVDNADEVRQDMENNYNQALKDSGKRREPGSGGRGPGAGGMGKKRGKKGRR